MLFERKEERVLTTSLRNIRQGGFPRRTAMSRPTGLTVGEGNTDIFISVRKRTWLWSSKFLAKCRSPTKKARRSLTSLGRDPFCLRRPWVNENRSPMSLRKKKRDFAWA